MVDMAILLPLMTTPTDTYAQLLLGLLITGFIFAFILSIGVGANDVANSFGSSVGSKALTLRQACYLATTFETLGAVLIGYRVADTVRKGMFDPTELATDPVGLMCLFISSLIGSTVWLFTATGLSLPVSGSHSIVGAVIGAALVRAHQLINWKQVLKIVASWFVSPLLSGLISSGIFFLARHFIIQKDKPIESGLVLLPFIYIVTIFINTFSIVYKGPSWLYLDDLPVYYSLLITLGVCLLSGLLVRIFLVPYTRKVVAADVERANVTAENGAVQRHIDQPILLSDVDFKAKGANNSSIEAGDVKAIDDSMVDDDDAAFVDNQSDINQLTVTKIQLDNRHTSAVQAAGGRGDAAGNSRQRQSSHSEASNGPSVTTRASGMYQGRKRAVSVSNSSIMDVAESLSGGVPDDPAETKSLFTTLQVLVACFGGFAHGGNDVSNSVSPLIALWMIYMDCFMPPRAETPWFILLFGAAGITVGLWVFGKRVIETMGKSLSKITPSSGFCIELGAATTVLLASNLSLPISTTHCKVGSIVFVGRYRSRENVDWKLFRNILLAWFVTLPAAGLVAAGAMFFFRLGLGDYIGTDPCGYANATIAYYNNTVNQTISTTTLSFVT